MILSTPLSAPPLSPWTLLPAGLALCAYLAAALDGPRSSARWALLLAWVAHGLAGLAHLFGIGLPGDGARFGFAPALSATAWLVLTVHAVESRFLPLTGVRRWLALLGGGTLALALAFPGAGQIHPQSPWAPLHWMLGLASYGLFGAAVLHATLLDRSERALRQRLPTDGLAAQGLPLLTLEKLTFRFVAAGFGVLTLAILMGAWFSAAWHWDHKTVFSVLGWAVFASLLAGRQMFGWRGRRATRWLYINTLLLLLSYVGSRFVFEVLLHRPTSAALLQPSPPTSAAWSAG